MHEWDINIYYRWTEIDARGIVAPGQMKWAPQVRIETMNDQNFNLLDESFVDDDSSLTNCHCLRLIDGC